MSADIVETEALARLKDQWQRQKANALLNDLSDKLAAMAAVREAGDPFDDGYAACWHDVREWMVSQGRVLNGENGTT